VRAALRLDMRYAGAYRAWREVIPGDAALLVLDEQLEAWTAGRIYGVLLGVSSMPGARSHADWWTLAVMLNVLFLELLRRAAIQPLDEAAFEARCDILTRMISGVLVANTVP
jgi:hypothetical protein